MENPIRKLIFFQPIRSQHFCNNWRPHSEDFSEKIRLRVTSIDISSCWWRGHGEGCVTCHLSWGWFKLVWDWKVSWCCALCLDLVFYHIICWRCPRGAPEKNRKRTNFYRTLSNNFAIFFIGTIFHSDEKILIKKIAVSSANQITPFRSDFSSESKLTTLNVHVGVMSPSECVTCHSAVRVEGVNNFVTLFLAWAKKIVPPWHRE
jgi:hypothetical protein